MTRLAISVLAAALSTGCAMPAVNAGPDPMACLFRDYVVVTSADDSLRGGMVVASTAGSMDTERMIQPDPVWRTFDHLHALHYNIRRFREAHHELPATLEAFSPDDAPGLKINVDAWGNRVGYVRVDAESYEVRAPGADSRFCTEDDMILRDDVLPDDAELARLRSVSGAQP